MRLLIIEDDIALIDLISQNLSAKFKVDCAFNCRAAKSLIAQKNYRLIIVRQAFLENRAIANCQLKKEITFLILISGLACLRQMDFLKAHSCDFLIKPFTAEELNSKVELLLARQKINSQATNNLLQDKEIVLNEKNYQLFYGNQKIQLNYKEFVLLKLLLNRCGQTLSRELLANLVWEDDLVVFGNSIATYVYQLRRKLARLNCPKTIKTIRGLGYLWHLE